jgi:hypothetical protein
MAKRSVAYKSDRGQFPNTTDYKGDFQGSTQPKSKLSGGFDPGTMKYSKPIGPVKPVGQRMDEYSRQQLAKLKQKAAAPVPKPKPKPPQVIRTTVSERVTPANAPATAPARMAVNRATGDTTGFTTGKTTGKTVTKAGTAYKTPMTGLQRMNQNAFNKGGVAGPSKSSASRSTGGANRSTGGASRSTGGTRASNPSRGDVGAGRRGGGR